MTIFRMAKVAPKLARCLAVSMALVSAGWQGADAHELRPAIADVLVTSDRLEIRLELALEALVAEIDASALDDTDEDPNAERYDALRAKEPADLEAELRSSWEGLRSGFQARAGETTIPLELQGVEIPEVGDIELVRDSIIGLTAALPDDGTEVRFGWSRKNGAIVVRQDGAGEGGYAALLEGGELSQPLPRLSSTEGGFGARVLRFFFGD